MRAKSASSSATMGDLLLGGWTMLAEGCPTCHVPLMRDPSSQEDVCVECGRTTRVGVAGGPEDGWHRDEGSREERSEEHDANGGEEHAEEQDASAKLAQKMLEGWKMLADHCPLCRTPLCKSRQGETRCVACDLPVRREGANDVERKDAVEGRGEGRGASEEKQKYEETADELQGAKRRVMGGVLQYMESVAGGLSSSVDPRSDGGRLEALNACAEILKKLDGIVFAE